MTAGGSTARSSAPTGESSERLFASRTKTILAKCARLDVIVHNAGHMSYGPAELARWGMETSIIVPGAFTNGTNHFAHAGAPADEERADEYAKGPTGNIAEVALRGLASLEPPDADATSVARAIVTVVDAPFGKRPFRVHIDPAQDGAEIVNGVADRVRAELLRNLFTNFLGPKGLRALANEVDDSRNDFPDVVGGRAAPDDHGAFREPLSTIASCLAASRAAAGEGWTCRLEQARRRAARISHPSRCTRSRHVIE